MPTYMGHGEVKAAIVRITTDILCCPGQTTRVQMQKSMGPPAVGDPG